jgi:hypothetical protein
MGSGRTRPCLLICGDDEGNQVEVVVKFRAGLETGFNGLVCEALASLLAIDLDLPVPEPVLVLVDDLFANAILPREFANLARQSVGLNFGTRKLPSGLNTWPNDKAVPVLLRPLASEIFAFDVIIQNPDRRLDNPNIQWKGTELYIYDHELAFSFVIPVIGWQPPWTGEGLDFLQQHIFYRGLRGAEIDLARITGAFEAITDERLNEYVNTVPESWRNEGGASEKIVEYLREARQNIEEIANVIGRFLR